MSAVDTCTECGRPLLYSNGALICCWRHCPVYGVDVSDEEVTSDTDPSGESEQAR